jgi:maltose O-acetyltransferase
MKIKTFLAEFKLFLCNHVVNSIPSHTVRLFFYRKIMKFKIGQKSYIFMGCTFDSAGNFNMGSESVVNSNCRLDTRGGIKIGNNVSISNDVIILTADHDMDTPSMLGRTKYVEVDDYAWIGTRAMIMPGVCVRNGAVVAAGAIATKNVEPFAVVAGVPAKLIKYRRSDTPYSYTASYKRTFQ